MRFKKSPRLPGAGRTKAWHHHGSDTPTSPRAIYGLKSAKDPNLFINYIISIFCNELSLSLPELRKCCCVAEDAIRG